MDCGVLTTDHAYIRPNRGEKLRLLVHSQQLLLVLIGYKEDSALVCDVVNMPSMTTSTALLTWINIPTRALCWTFTVIFLLETSKIILHCHQSGDDNIAAYVFDNAERQVKQIVDSMILIFFQVKWLLIMLV